MSNDRVSIMVFVHLRHGVQDKPWTPPKPWTPESRAIAGRVQGVQGIQVFFEKVFKSRN